MTTNPEWVPTGDTVIIRKIETGPSKTKSGLELPESLAPELATAEVIAVGPGLYNAYGTRMALDLKPGDTITYTTLVTAMTPPPQKFVSVDGKTYFMIRGSAVLAYKRVVENTNG